MFFNKFKQSVDGVLMRVLVDEKAIADTIAPLGISYDIRGYIKCDGLECKHIGSCFYFEEKKSAKTEEYIVVDIADEGIWQIEKLMNPIDFKKQILFENDEEVNIYFLRTSVSQIEHFNFNYIEKNKNNQDVQLKCSDAYLFIPGKLEEASAYYNQFRVANNSLFDEFKKNINFVINEEYNSDFAQKIDRIFISNIILKICETYSGIEYRQRAMVSLVMHDIGFCVIEIIVPNCAMGTNKLLNYYCGNQLMIIYNKEEYSLDSFCDKIKVQRYGKKRSMVFTYGQVSDREIVNALANEEKPMGNIKGALLEKIKNENIAQYDTAEVYVSNETMLEKCEVLNNVIEDRLIYHSIEIFFVELILFRDAAIDKVYCDLNCEEENQTKHGDAKIAVNRYEQLIFDMAQAIRFTDFQQFSYPITRISAQNVARCFGIDNVLDKYNDNKEMLKEMIVANKRQQEEKQNKVKNMFLLFISALATIGTLGDILYAVITDEKNGLFSYVLSAVVIVVGFVVYKIIQKIYNKLCLSRLKR